MASRRDTAGAAVGKRTALFWACWGMQARLELVELLLQHDADPNAQTAYDGTPLHSAIMWDQGDIVRVLIAAGADPACKDAKGRTARDAASGRTRELLDKLAPKESVSATHLPWVARLGRDLYQFRLMCVHRPYPEETSNMMLDRWIETHLVPRLTARQWP